MRLIVKLVAAVVMSGMVAAAVGASGGNPAGKGILASGSIAVVSRYAPVFDANLYEVAGDASRRVLARNTFAPRGDHPTGGPVAVSSDGVRIAFTRVAGGGEAAYAVDRRTGMTRRVSDALPGNRRMSSIAWSPDGRRLAVVTEDGLLYVADAETRRLRIRRTEGPVSSVTWSSAGRWMAVHVYSDTDVTNSWFEVMDAGGSSRRRVAADTWYGWSADESRAAFSRGETVVIAAASGKTLRTLPFRSFAAEWAPRGTRLAVQLTGGGFKIVDGDGRTIGPHHREAFLRWSPGGTAVPMPATLAKVLGFDDNDPDWEDGRLVSVSPDGRYAVIYERLVDLATGNQTEIRSKFNGYTLGWAPNSRSLLFVEPSRGLARLAVPGLRRTNVVRYPPGTEADFAAVLPDGKVAYRVATTHDPRVFELRLESGVAALLTSGTGGYDDPAWSPTGESIAALFDDKRLPDDASLVRLSGAGDVPHLVARDPGSDPTWSPDGGRIAFLRSVDETELVIVDVSAPGAVTETILARIPRARDVAWSPRASSIAVDTRDGILLLSVERPSEQTTIVVPAAARSLGSKPAWSPDGKLLAYRDRDGIYVVPVAGGPPSRLVELRGATASRPTWSPDGSWIAYAGPAPPAPGSRCEFSHNGLFAVPVGGGPPVRLPALACSDIKAPAWRPVP